MKKPTTLRTLIFVLALLFNFASYSQNWVAFNSKLNSSSNENLFLKANNQFNNQISLDNPSDNAFGLTTTPPAIPNPIKKYAEYPYAGTVSTCPNDGSELPKLFLCGSNETREIDTGITNATSIVWMKRTGGCTPNTNGNCANTADNCTWADVVGGQKFIASAAGEYKVVIKYPDASVFTFYFNVYKNEVDPTGIVKTNIVRSNDGSCVIPGRIVSGGFSNLYEYSFTTNPAPNTWQDSNTFITPNADTYNVFIRLKSAPDGCVFSVKNVVIDSKPFSTSLTATQPACVSNNSQGKIKVTANTLNNEYVYTLYRSSNLTTPIAFSPQKSIAEHEFTGLSAGNYTVVTTVKNTGSGTCEVKDTQSIEIKAANALNNTSSISRTLKVCETGIIQGNANGGAGTTYRYFVSYNGGAFTLVPNDKVIIEKGGRYIMRVEDLNGCSAEKTFDVADVAKPVYNITTTTTNTCNPTGTITVTVTNKNGYNTIQYSKNLGANWDNGNLTTGTGITYKNLDSGSYDIMVRYRTGNSGSYCEDAFTTVTIGTTTALTASAGVAALPGCDPYPEYGIVRITNPQGGTPPYEYFFNTDAINGGGWNASNVGYLKEGGPYTVSIRDKNGCKFDMTGIRIDGKPSPPKIDKGPITYNCDGTATQTVIINNGAGDSRYTFQYYIDGNPNPNTAQPNVFLNVPEGQHFITVDYNVKSASTYSNLLDESFGSGENTTSPGINTFYYCFERQIPDRPDTYCNGSYAINDGDYSVTSSINQTATSGWNWRYPVDHTSIVKGTSDPKGRFLAVNIGDKIPVTTILYEKQINDVIPNQPIMFEFYAMNLMMPGKGKADPNLTIALVDPAGNEISSFATGSIARSSSNNDWKKFPQTAITLDPGNYTSLRLIVRSSVQEDEGNDVAIDDIKVFQVPRVCGAQFKWDFTITPPPPFIAHVENLKGETCFGAKDGSFDIFAENFTGEFYYSINNEEPWRKSTTDRVTIGPLGAATYSVRVRKDPTSMGCDFDIPTTITSPAKLRFTVSATTATCSQRAVVTATSIVGGTSPYNLVLTNKANGATKPFNLDPTDLLYKATDVDPGNYTVTATDKNSCPADVTADITVNGSDKPEAEIQSTSNLCLGGTNGASINILIKKGVGPFRYRVKRNTGQYGDYSDPFTTFTFTHNVTTSGNYEFEILDLSSSCTAEVISQQIDPQIGAKTAIISALSCKQTGSEATIEVTIEGGTAPFSYVVKNTLNQQVDSGTTTNPVFQYSTSIDDTYTFEITDGHNCPISISRKVDKLVRPTATAHPHNPTCFGGTGSVDLEGLEGLAPFKFDFNGSGTFKDQTNYTGLTGSAAGTLYTYKVKDANDCERSYDFKIFEPAELKGKATIDPVYNCDHPATITVSDVSGGTGTRKYTLLRNNVAVVGPQDSNVFTGINVAGNYTVRITDANSCSVVENAGTVNALNAPTAMTITTTTAATCPDNKGSVTITNVRNAAGVAITGTLEYRIIAPITVGPNSTGVFNNLDANVEYTFEVRDANQCKVTDKHTIAPPATFTVEGDPGTVTCFNATDGTATFTVTGIASGTNYSYVVDSRPVATGTSTGSPFEIDVTGLTAGSHRITVTNSTTNCPIIEDVTVGGPTAALRLDTPDLTHVTCKVKGTATIHALDGSGSYTYTVTPTSPAGAAKVQVNDNIFVGLNAGEYSVSVTDLTGCRVTGQTFTINASVNPDAEISVTSTYCAGGAGATLIATPKSAPKPNPNYEYKLNSGNYQPSGTFTGLTPGKYTITVRDIVTGCTAELAEETIETPLSASAKIDADLTCDPTSPEAIIGVTIQGGYPDYTYLVNTTGAPFTGTPIAVGTGLTKFTVPRLAGTYYFEITDNKGCKVVVSQTVNTTTKPDFSTQLSHVLCKGEETGSITVNATPAGSYTYEVTRITPSGTKISQSTNLFQNLGAGIYSVVVIDAKKCASDAKQVTINEPLVGLTATADVDVKLTCDASNNAIKATIKVTASGGTPYPAPNLYRYSYNGLAPVISDTYSTTASGNVSVKVFDANNCEVEVTGGVTIDALNPPTAIAFAPPAAITCETGHDKTSLTLTVTNGVLPFTYEITTPTATVVTNVSSNSHTFTGLAPGHYYFKVTDANKCTVTDDFEILDVVKIQATGSIASNVTCNGLSNGSISFTVSGNKTGGYSTKLVGSISNEILSTPSITPSPSNPANDVVTYTGLKGGEKYTFTVTNSVTKCVATSEVTLADPVLVQITNVSGTKVFCAPNVKTTIVVTATGGKAPLKYAVVKTGVTPAATDFVEGNTFIKDTSLGGLDYDVYVQDGNSCPASTAISITRNDSPTIDPITAPLCYAGAAFNVTITGSVYVGSTTKLYGLDGVYNTNPVKSISGPGTYELGIKDDNGCETTTTINVNDQLKLETTFDKDITCSAPQASQITLKPSGGNGSYTYEYRLAPSPTFVSMPSNVFNTTGQGDYYFKVSSAGCSVETTVPVKVSDPQKPTASAISTNPKCNNSPDGTITVTGSGGIPGYQYRINGGAWQNSAVFTDLAAAVAPGTVYSYEVIDMKGCISDPINITLVQPNPIVVDRTIQGITCNASNGVSLGSITIDEVTGGTGPYDYYVTGKNYYKEFKNVPGTSQVFEIVDFGLYEVRIVDSNNCPYIEEVTITSPPDDLDITVNAPPIANCSALGSATVSVGSKTSIPVGNGPFYFSYYTGVPPVYPTTGTWYPETTPLQAEILNLIPGVRYTFIVYDSKSGCYYYEIADLPIPSNSTLDVGAPTGQNVTCTGSADGKVSFVVTSNYGVDTPITYQVYDALSLAPLPINGSGTVPANGTLTIDGFGAMAHGDYFVLVTEAPGATSAGCSKSTAMFSIRQSAVILDLDYEIVQNDNCKTEAGIIKVTGKDGAGSYRYMVTTTPGTPLATDSAWTTTPTFNRDSGNYYAWVKDQYGCIKGSPVFLLPLDPDPIIDLKVADLCAIEGNYQIDVDLTNTATAVGPFYISVNNNTGYALVTSFPHHVSGLVSGKYDIYVKDKNGCEVSQTINITPTPKAKAEVTTDLVCDASGAVGPNAVITVTITSGTGTPNFTYAVKKGTGAFGGDNAILPAGSRTFTYPVAAGDADTYVFLIKDANGCEIETTPVAVDPIVPIVPTSTPTQPLCFGGTGTILLSATGGKGTYEYTLIRTAPTAGTLITQSVPLFENLIAGDYDYTIKDELGCIVTGTQTLGQPDELILDTPTIDQPECGANNAPQKAKIVLAAHGGTGAYEYSFNGSDFSADTNTFYVDQNGASQTIPYAIRDENGCPKTDNVTILWLDPPTKFDFDQPDPITCIRATTSVEIRNVIGGIAPLTYQIVSATGTVITDNNTNPVFTSLLPGDYIFQVTDANKCIKQLKYTVKDVIKIDITEQSITHITCLGAGDGKASFLVTSFATSYDYVLDTDGPVTMTTGTIDLTGLAPGPHKITVTDNETGCPKDINFDINTITTALDFTMDVTPLGCETTGAVTVTATDGWGSYTYTVTEPAPASTVLPSNTNGVFAGLTKVGTYIVTVKDANGCVDTDTFVLTTPIEPVASIDATSVYCYTGSGVGQGATIVVNATTPGTPAYTPVYQYSINNGASWHGNTFTDLAPGKYEVTVKDQYGCQAVTSVPVEIKGQIFASAKRETEIFCGPVDGLIKLEVVGGYAPFSYTVTKDGILDPTVFTFVGNSTTADYVVAGTGGNVDYKFNITDAHSCPVSTNVVHMSNPTIITFDSKPISPSCTAAQGNGSDGQILVELTGAALADTQEYTFTLTPPVGLPRTQTNGLFTGLEAGTYSVTVSSARSCPVTQNNIIIDVPAAVVAEAKAADFACTPANVIKQTIVTVTGNHGAGVEPITNFTYSNNGTNWYKTNEFKVDNKSTVQHLTYYVKDLKGCISSDVIDIDPFPELISATPKTAISADCKNGGLETITVDIDGGQMPYHFEYQVSKDGNPYGTATAVTGTNTFDYVATDAGHKYQFKITDVNTGCTVISSAYDVKLYNIMTVTATASKMASCNTFNDGTITINIDKYTGLYDYRVLLPGNPVAVLTGTNINAGTNNPYVITGLAAGIDYTVEVTQNAYPECTVTSNPVTITEPSPVNISGIVITVKNQNCHTQEATITVDPASISGGTGTYMYAFVPAGATPVDSDYQASNIKTFATNKIAPLFDSYDVYVRDANLCDRFQNVHISLDPMPVINNVTVADQCPSTTGYRIDVDATGLAKLQYRLDNGEYQDNNYFIVKDPGDYTVWVWDKNQCPVKWNTTVTVLKPLTLEGEVTVYPTCNTATGTVKLTAGGGTVTTPSSYIYSIDGWATDQTFNEFANLAPGKYTFSVKDIVTNCTNDVEVKIATAVDVIGVTLKARPVSCNSYSNGGVSVTLAASNIDMPYTYSISGPASNPTVNIVNSASSDFNDLPAGLYTVTVKSGRGCVSALQTVEVTQPDPIEVNASFTEYACTTGTNDTNNATITVNSVTGGSGKYVRYEFRRDGILVYDGPSTTYTEKDHLGGTYIITAFDDKDCQGDNTSPIEVRSFATLLGMDFTVTPITCVTGETIQTVVDVKGTLTTQLRYTLTGTGDTVITPEVNNTGLFQNLAIGTYLVTVLNPATGCTISQNHLVLDPNAFAFKIDATRTDICFGQADGSVVLTLVDNRPYPTDRAGEFRYTVTGPVPSSGNSTGTTLALNGLRPGRYEVAARLINSPECDVRTTFDIAAPSTALTMNVAVGRITCAAGSNDGSLDVSAEGGWPGTYQYKLDGPVSYGYSAEGHFANLTPGRYTISVKDSNECEITDIRDFDVPGPIVFTAAATSTVLSCYGDDSGVITVSAPTGGEGANYVYSLNYTTPEGDASVLGPQDSNVFTGLRAGTYTVTVTDGFSCEATSPTTITLTNPLVIEPILSLTTGVKCTTDATVTLSATGGTGPYTYSEDGTNYSAPFNSTVTFPVTLGLHKYYVQDNLGCVKISNELNIEPLTPLDIELDSRNAVVNCKGDSSAIINAVAKGGLGDYQYSLLDSTHAEVRPAQADGIFLDLPAGSYIVRVVSGDCEKEVAVTVTEAAVKLTSSYEAEPIKCFGEKTGKIVMTASGGTGAIKFAISPFLAQFVDSGTFERLEAGTYTVIVQDVLGCTEIHNIEITQPQILIANEIPNSMIPEICKGDNNGGFSIQVRGGTAPYYESLDNSKGVFNLITGNEKDYTGLTGGKHTVFIQDANGCITEVEVNMPEPVVLNPTVEVLYDCVNNAQANMVIVKVDDSNSPTDVDYSLDGGDFVPSNIFTNVAPGRHTITARHSNDCRKDTDTFEIDAVAEVGLIDLTNQSKDINTIVVQGTGGVAPYEYSFNGEPFTSSNSYRIYKTDNYSVVVRDKNGCIFETKVPGTFYDFCMPNYFTPNGATNTTIGPDCGALAYKELTFDIYDRYGRVVAKYRVGGKWDGRYHGSELPTGDYWYVLKLNDPKDPREFVGHFTLYR
ncbi:T9SS type B sorting domain-containing protein [Flavobacterium sp. DG2-3]|uniref:T9SS type B sorting domain-containing protein n=1 Tax=Flavobacterium sp. DG2-3 TaxID=3068317 RepID=UPI00273FF760|nr:T9SS type B sorting domain-containing protein [Flavobacterium sp. DG2-3]MDP5198362.1 T9SS type B sorting domain-containing protein [Flavobacterium sp. DG2-3]